MSTGAGGHDTDAFAALNPMRQVPVLRLPDGTLMTETGAMVLHLCDTRPEAGLLPAPGTPERAAAYRWLFWMVANLYESDLRYYYPARYTADPAGSEGVRRAAEERMDRLLAIAEAELGDRPWFLGETYSALDPYLAMLTLWHPARQAVLGRWPRLGRLLRRVRERPAIGRIWTQHYPPGGDHPWSTWTSSSAS